MQNDIQTNQTKSMQRTTQHCYIPLCYVISSRIVSRQYLCASHAKHYKFTWRQFKRTTVPRKENTQLLHPPTPPYDLYAQMSKYSKFENVYIPRFRIINISNLEQKYSILLLPSALSIHVSDYASNQSIKRLFSDLNPT